jgi:hypothetical protein
MNASQQARYGALPTTTDPLKRWCACPVCGARYGLARRGRGNARAVASLVRGMVMQHLRERHPDYVAGTEA